MMSRRTILFSIVLALMLTGCFRQASEPFESVDESQPGDSSNVQATVPPLATATFEEQEPTLEPLPTDETVVTEEDPTESLPTLEPLATDTPGTSQSAATQEDTLPTLGGPITSTPIVVQPTNTSAPPATNTPQVPATNSGSNQGSVNTGPTLTPTFITPGVPAGSGNTTPLAPNATPATATPSGLITPTDFLNPNNVPEECLYIVRSGDNLFRIALNNSLTLDQLRAANPQIRSDVIQPGDQIVLPVAGCEGESAPSTPPESSNATPGAPQNQIIHIVQSGETLGQIARRYGTTIAAITQANSLTDPNRLSIGQQLIIPQE